MIVITGAAGFIASYWSRYLNKAGYTQLILVDDFNHPAKIKNFDNIAFAEKVNRDVFLPWFETNANQVEAVFHLGARTDTTEKDETILNQLNFFYSQAIWTLCTRFSIPLFYASSAATYGNGSYGYIDDHALLSSLEPLNPYAVSKHKFDLWVMNQKETPPHWYGFKFFNVFGPNEYHKERMASVVLHAYRQIEEKGRVVLFKSHKEGWKDGEQKRDFIYVKDLASILMYFFLHKPQRGIYNVGTGQARSFIDLAKAVFSAMKMDTAIDFIDMPEDIRSAYQYFTEARTEKLRQAGYFTEFHSLEDGIQDYITNYLVPNLYY